MKDEIVTVRPEVSTDTKQKLPYYVGISGLTAGSRGLSLNMVVIPAGGKAEAHSHNDFETAIYLLKGEVETRYGKNLEKSVVHHSGDFIFIPPNVPHQPKNLSLDEAAIAIVARNDPNEQENVSLYQRE